MLNSPVVLFIYKRYETTLKVFNVIRKVKPKTFYLISDGPKSLDDIAKCQNIRDYIEQYVDWDCKFKKIYSITNTGLAERISSGLDIVFAQEETAIILEDDTLPDVSFFKFCDTLLDYYKDNNLVGHISGCNHHASAFYGNTSYNLSAVINIWGWATWRRAWKHFELKMPSWHNKNKDEFLKIWCRDRIKRKGMKKMFELHCMNDDPWAWSYQWAYACYSNNLLSIVPRVNLVSNLGIGPTATNTKSKLNIEAFPLIKSSIEKNIKHPNFGRDYLFEDKYYKKDRTPIIRIIKSFLKKIFFN